MAVGAVSLNSMDKHAYPGCTVLGQIDKTVIIELGPWFNGTDGACVVGAAVIHSIAKQGFNVKVTNWNIPNKTFTPAEAKAMAEYEGAY